MCVCVCLFFFVGWKIRWIDCNNKLFHMHVTLLHLLVSLWASPILFFYQFPMHGMFVAAKSIWSEIVQWMPMNLVSASLQKPTENPTKNPKPEPLRISFHRARSIFRLNKVPKMPPFSSRYQTETRDTERVRKPSNSMPTRKRCGIVMESDSIARS